MKTIRNACIEVNNGLSVKDIDNSMMFYLLSLERLC